MCHDCYDAPWPDGTIDYRAGDYHYRAHPDGRIDQYVLTLRDVTTPESILDTAHRRIEQGNAQYGPPAEGMTRAANLWTTLLADKLQDGEFITAADVARCMIAVKLARDAHKPSTDNRVDIAGYAALLEEVP